jgi:hypothetical protein
MRNALTVIGPSLGLLLSSPVASLAQTPDAIIELSGGSVAAGIGYSWGTARSSFTASTTRSPYPACPWPPSAWSDIPLRGRSTA